MNRFGVLAKSFALLALLTVVTVPAVGNATTAAAAKPVSGGTWTIGTLVEVSTLDTLRTVNASTGLDRSFLVFDSLMRLDAKTGALLPGLAASLTTNDAQNWTMKLRPDLKFSDGTPLDAEAVIFNYKRLQEPASAYPAIASVSQITKMTAVDPVTVQFQLGQPNGSFGLIFADAPGQIGSPTAIKAGATAFGQKPVGAGPFLLQSWVRDQQSTFVRNPNYYEKGRPYIDSIVFKIIPDQTSLANALRSGTIDAIHAATQASARKIAEDNPTTISAGDITKTPGAAGFGCNLAQSPCDDARFRRAISLAFDFDLVKQAILAPEPYASKVLRCMPFGTGSPFCAKETTVKFNPTKAKELIDQVKADGINTDISFLCMPASPTPNFGEFVQQQLAKIGVKATLRVVSTTEYVTITTQRSFQTAVVINPTAAEMGTRYYNDWHSIGGANGGRDVLNLNNAQLDVALEKGRNSVKLADKVAGFQEAQRIMASQFLVSWIAPTFNVVVFKNALQLQSWDSPTKPFLRYNDVWIKAQK